MDLQSSTHARSEPTLPEGAPQVLLTAPAGQPRLRFETRRPVTLIGSRRDCDLFVNQGDVSKIHCALVNTGTAIFATDLCSRSGTFVNDERVFAAALRSGDELRIGSVHFKVEVLGRPDGAAAEAAHEIGANVALPVPLRLTGAEQQYELATLPAVIGRRNTCQVVLDTPDVSLVHALLFTIDGCPAVFDLGSRSGTHLNTARVTLAWLRDGERLCIGGEELTLAWEGPQYAEREPAASGVSDSVDTAEADGTITPFQVSRPEDFASMIEGLKAQVSVSQAKLRERAVLLDQREAELQARNAESEQERSRLALEKQQFNQQAAALHLGASRLEQDRARFDAERAQLARERSRLDARRVEFEQRLAEYETMVGRLREREVALDERQAALEAAEQEVAQKQADLAQREAASVEAMRGIEQFKDALSQARRVFASLEAFPEGSAPRGAGPVASASPAFRAVGETPPATDRRPADPDLPAPMVNEPLFAGLDADSPERWPEEWQERLRFLRHASGKSDADTLSQVLAEFHARHRDDHASPGKDRKKPERGWSS